MDNLHNTNSHPYVYVYVYQVWKDLYHQNGIKQTQHFLHKWKGMPVWTLGNEISTESFSSEAQQKSCWWGAGLDDRGILEIKAAGREILA